MAKYHDCEAVASKVTQETWVQREGGGNYDTAVSGNFCNECAGPTERKPYICTSAASIHLYEDKEKAPAGCKDLSDHCCANEDYCCRPDGARGKDKMACGFIQRGNCGNRFLCSGGERAPADCTPAVALHMCVCAAHTRGAVRVLTCD